MVFEYRVLEQTLTWKIYDYRVCFHIYVKPEALKSLYRSPGYKKKPIGPM